MSDCVAATSSGEARDVAAMRAEILALHKRRGEAEAKVQEALDFLDTTPVGMDGRLIDDEGFPRADCDLYAVRTARNTVICGRNDLRAMEEELYEKLGELHDAARPEAEAEAAQAALDKAERVRKEKEQEAARELEKEKAGGDGADAAVEAERAQLVERLAGLSPILKVASVEAASPAADAGLRAGWAVLQYGDLNADNIRERGLPTIRTLTLANEGKSLSVWVREGPGAAPRELFIVPRQWSGNGLLGCALDPV